MNGISRTNGIHSGLRRPVEELLICIDPTRTPVRPTVRYGAVEEE